MQKESFKVKIIADNREMHSDIFGYIQEHGAELKIKNLKTGDYIASDRVCIERKTVPDFLQSIVDQRMFRQADVMMKSFKRPLLIMEGNPEDLFNGDRNIHENAIRGALSSLTIDYRIPVLWTHSQRETAAQIYWIAYREQFGQKKDLQIRYKARANGIKQQQEFLVSGLPLISNKMSKKLLEHFKTPKDVFNADVKELRKVDKMGPKKAERIRSLLDSSYKK
ncbi:MAG: ERCC4 domain-containing protein [Nanoarchaeota archaeon]